MNQFIDIEWKIEKHDRDNYYIRIDCFKNENLNKIIKYNCCLKSREGCNIIACGCEPADGWWIRLYDKYNNLIDEKAYNKSFSTIVIEKNAENIPNITLIIDE